MVRTCHISDHLNYYGTPIEFPKVFCKRNSNLAMFHDYYKMGRNRSRLMYWKGTTNNKLIIGYTCFEISFHVVHTGRG